MIWVQFLACAALVVVVGSQLSNYADILAEKTGLGRGWVGAVLLAGATSLPELATGISAVTVVGDIDLAAGGIMGSCLFNLLLIAMLDLMSGTTPLLRRAQISHVLAAGLGSILLTSTATSMFIAHMPGLPLIGWVSIPSILIIGGYFVSMQLISFFEQRRAQEVREQEAIIEQYGATTLRRAGLIFALLTVAIMALGLWLANIGDQIASQTGLGESFVGAIFLAITTSLPEIVAALAAIRLGAIDLAVSNVFGSNIFNIFALALYDLFYTPGDIWSHMAQIHSFAAVVAALMTSLAIVGLTYRAARKPRWALSWDALLLVLAYSGSMYVIYAATS